MVIMYPTIPFSFWNVLLVLCATSRAIPFDAAPVEGRAVDPFTLSMLNSSGPYNFDDEPWGPDYFSISESVATDRLNQLDMYMFVINTISTLGFNDWDTLLPARVNNFNTPQISMSVVRSDNVPSLGHKYVIWALASLIHHATWIGNFHGGTWALEVQEQEVAKLTLVSGPVTPGVTGSSNATSQAVNTTNLDQNPTSIVAVGETEFTWTYAYNTQLLRQTDVLMGTIGALIMAAKNHANARSGGFIGYFTSFRAKYVFVPENPTVFTKAILIETMVNMVNCARDQSNWHAQKTVVSAGRQRIATGGYGDLQTSGGTADASTS